MTLNPKIFRAYDIRGNAADDLDDDSVRAIGRGFAALVFERIGKTGTVAVGYDCRLSSPRITNALKAGLMLGGMQVTDIGLGPSPLLYFASHELGPDGAIIVTGSHNRGEDNGFKLLVGGSTIHTDEIQNLRSHAQRDHESKSGGSEREESVTDRYLAACAQSIGSLKRPLHVVVDAGNGTGGPFAVALYKQLGCTVTELYCDMDGTFPNHHPDPTVPDNLRDLQKAVVENQADLGVAFDGDADRLGAVDNLGRVIPGDRLLLMFGQHIARLSPGAKIIGEVKCSGFVYAELRRAGAEAIMWKVGHSLIKAKMKQEEALLAGEMSGHFFFADRFFGFDDGVYAGARLIELLAETETPFSELVDQQPEAHATPEVRIPANRPKETVAAITPVLSALEGVTETLTIDGVRVEFSDGWGLARSSNTEPVIVMRAEGQTPKRRDEIAKAIREAISAEEAK